jgi:hypothetical protein
LRIRAAALIRRAGKRPKAWRFRWIGAESQKRDLGSFVEFNSFGNRLLFVWQVLAGMAWNEEPAESAETTANRPAVFKRVCRRF